MINESSVIYIARSLSIGTILFVVLLSIVSNKIKMTKYQCISIIFFLSLAFSIISFFSTEIVRGDFDWFRHSMLMNQIRNSNISLIEFVFQNRTFIGGEEYKDLISFNVIRYIITRVTTHNELICSLFSFANIFICCYITADWNKNTGSQYKLDFFSLLLSQTFLPYILYNGNLRFGLCTTIMGLAVYLYLFKNKSIYLFCFMSFVASTIHPAALITLMLVFISKMDLGIKGYLAVFMLSPLANVFATFFAESNIHYIRLIAHKYLVYTSDEQYRSFHSVLYTVIIISTITIIIYFITIRYSRATDLELDNRRGIYQFMAYDILFSLSNIGNYDMVIRPASILGALSVVLCSIVDDDLIWRNCSINRHFVDIIRVVIKSIFVGLGLYVNFKLIVTYHQYYF